MILSGRGRTVASVVFWPVRRTRVMHAGALAPRTHGESLKELWRINGTVLTRFALKLSQGDKYRADDIVQETMLRAWRHPEVVEGHADTIRRWLFAVARNVATDLWRRQTRHDDILVDETA